MKMRSAAAIGPELSIVIPVFNEAENLPELYRRLTAVLRRLGNSFELIFVDDGSVDESVDILKRLAADARREVGVICLTRNYGQHGALMAGLRAARGEVIVTLDADLQAPPEEIPALLEALHRGGDLVCGVPHKRHAPWTTRLSSLTAHHLMCYALQLPPGVRFSAFRAMSRQLVDRLTVFSSAPVQLETLIRRCTDRIGIVEIRHAARHAGRTKYTLARRLAFAMTLLSHVPHVVFRGAIAVGVMLGVLSIVAGVAVVCGAPHSVSVPAMLVLSAAGVLAGVIVVVSGFVGECVVQIQDAITQRPQYVVRECVGIGSAPVTVPQAAAR